MELRDETVGITHEPNARAFIFIVFYRENEYQDIYLASFFSEDDAYEYKSRSVWSHLDTYVSRQPVY